MSIYINFDNGIFAIIITGIRTGRTNVLKSKKLTPNNKNPRAVITNDILINISNRFVIADLTSRSALCLRFGLIVNLIIDDIGMIAAIKTAYRYVSIGVFR